MNEIELKGGHL
ncbi:Protein of unknown function [Lactobacillus helveticus CIRM-BIA 953]|uniref:Uncharacterized protein n=1 Tax=Lactobacillus helveticus CIRM-BIA 953 TaxID=1226335 RepID=U4QH45_LACHE|nr:Protein of unknown function [Lactobacillus helveticus CIRM-BIA 953]